MSKKLESKKSFWKSRTGFGLTAIVVVLACLAIRTVVSTEPANAQERLPSKVSRTKSSSKTTTRRTKTTAPKRVNPIAAVVNGQKITRQRLADQCIQRFGIEVLESLVNKHLILQECQAKGIKITRQDIDAEIENIARKYNISAELWVNMLLSEKNIRPEQYKLDVIWPTLALQRLAADKLQVTKEELTKEYEAEYGPKVQVRMISVKSKTQADKILAKAKANPNSFPELAKKESQDVNSAAARGLIPPIRKHLGYPEVEKVAFGLKPGQISPVIKVADQYIILRCEDHIEGAVISAQFRQNVEQQLTERIKDRKLRTVSAEVFQRLQSEAKVVNVFNNEKLRKQMPGVAATINGKKITMKKLADECLSRHGAAVLDSEINQQLLKQELNRLAMQVSEEDLDAEIARAAESFGYITKEGTADVEKWIAEITKKEGVDETIYIQDAVWPTAALKKIVGGNVTVTKLDIEKGFEANYGERVKVLAIVLSNQRQAHEVWEMARKDPSKENFGKLAEQFSIEPVSRANFGEVPPIHRHGGQPLVEQEAFSLKEGELSGIISVTDKFIILKCMGRTEQVIKNVADVKDELVAHIREEKLRVAMSERFEKIKTDSKVDNYFVASTAPANAAAKRQSVQPVSTRSATQRSATQRVQARR